MYWDQRLFKVRFEWGLSGVRLLGAGADVVVIVDALSFSTTVDVAVGRGARIFPCRWKSGDAEKKARELNAELAVRRGEGGRFSLSPGSMLKAGPGTRVVLPSQNGAELSAEGATLGRVVVAGCFRNASAVAQYAEGHGESVAIIGCGERWDEDETLRPAVEDLAAAGAIVAKLKGSKSPEARAAEAAWREAKIDLKAFLSECVSGRELIEGGQEDDVVMAAMTDVSDAIPLLREGAYVEAETGEEGIG